jgi:hypothetical protein
MQERFDQQAIDWLDSQPRILNGLNDFRSLERLALTKDVKGMKALLNAQARRAAQAQLIYWKKFFKLQRQSRGRPPKPWIETAASMRYHGKSWKWIAEWRKSNGDLAATKDSVCKAVKDYCRRTGIPLARGTGRNSTH